MLSIIKNQWILCDINSIAKVMYINGSSITLQVPEDSQDKLKKLEDINSELNRVLQSQIEAIKIIMSEIPNHQEITNDQNSITTETITDLMSNLKLKIFPIIKEHNIFLEKEKELNDTIQKLKNEKNKLSQEILEKTNEFQRSIAILEAELMKHKTDFIDRDTISAKTMDQLIKTHQEEVEKLKAQNEKNFQTNKWAAVDSNQD
jgi:C4-dicarboxylate-specific signal transduction histidine kinase